MCWCMPVFCAHRSVSARCRRQALPQRHGSNRNSESICAGSSPWWHSSFVCVCSVARPARVRGDGRGCARCAGDCRTTGCVACRLLGRMHRTRAVCRRRPHAGRVGAGGGRVSPGTHRACRDRARRVSGEVCVCRVRSGQQRRPLLTLSLARAACPRASLARPRPSPRRPCRARPWCRCRSRRWRWAPPTWSARTWRRSGSSSSSIAPWCRTARGARARVGVRGRARVCCAQFMEAIKQANVLARFFQGALRAPCARALAQLAPGAQRATSWRPWSSCSATTCARCSWTRARRPVRCSAARCRRLGRIRSALSWPRAQLPRRRPARCRPRTHAIWCMSSARGTTTQHVSAGMMAQAPVLSALPLVFPLVRHCARIVLTCTCAATMCGVACTTILCRCLRQQGACTHACALVVMPARCLCPQRASAHPRGAAAFGGRAAPLRRSRAAAPARRRVRARSAAALAALLTQPSAQGGGAVRVRAVPTDAAEQLAAGRTDR